MTSGSGIKIKKEDFKSLKDEINNIKGNINEEMYKVGVFINEREEYVWRANQPKKMDKTSPEQKYDLNEILKYYELNKDKYIQGFTSNYFRKLSDLMSKAKNKKYSRERLDLFNSRINRSQKIYNNYLKKNCKDSDIKSSLNKIIKNPFVTSLYPYNNKKNKKENNKLGMSQKNNILYNYCLINKKSNNISTFSYNEDKKKSLQIKIKNKNDSNELSKWQEEELDNSKLNTNKSQNKKKNIFLTKYYFYKNMVNKKIKKNNNNKNNALEKNFSFSYNNRRKSNSVDNKESDGKNEFFQDYNEEKYFNHLKKQYNFYISEKDEGKFNFEIKTKKRKNMFNLKTNSKFLEKNFRSTFKSDFMNKIKRKIKNENSPNIKSNNSNNIIYKRKIGELPSLSARLLKSTKINNDFNLIYEKVKKNLI